MNSDKKYQIIYADPPWRYSNRSIRTGAEKQYQTMTLKGLCALPVKDLAADDAVLFMWATYPTLPDALKLMDAWGFTYKTLAFQWVKLNQSGNGYKFGLGFWTRGNTEPCLLGVRGGIKRKDNTVSQLIFSPIREHSRKPDEVRDKIVRLMGGENMNKIELFARTSTPGWDVFGNETNKFDLKEKGNRG